MSIHGARRGHAIFIGVFFEIGVISEKVSIAAGKDIKDTLAIVAFRDSALYSPSPESISIAQPRAISITPATVRDCGHRGDILVGEHGVRCYLVRRLNAGTEEVVTVYRRTRGNSAHAYIVVPGRNYSCNVRAVMVEATIDVLVAAVVDVEARVDVVFEVFMGVVHPVVDHGDIDALSLNSVSPDGSEVDVLPIRTAQVPLTGIQRILICGPFNASVWAEQSSRSSVYSVSSVKKTE